MLTVVTNPELRPAQVDELIDVWVAVTNAGGAVGFTAPTDASTVGPVAEGHLALVADGRQDLVVGFADERIAGFAFLVRNGTGLIGHWGTVARLQRRPDLHGMGVGAAVLAGVEQVAAERGLELLTLSVRAGTGREAFYEAQGYTVDGALPGRLRMADGSTLASVYLSKALVADDPREPARTDLTDRQSQERPVRLRVQRIDPDLDLPAYAHPGDAGLDLRARIDVRLAPGERATVPTGVAVALPPGTVGLVHPRSGLAARHGIGMVNAPGTIDAGYRGEIHVILINHDRDEAVLLGRGERIAQLVVQRVEHVAVAEVEHLDGTERGGGGFGSTGR